MQLVLPILQFVLTSQFSKFAYLKNMKMFSQKLIIISVKGEFEVFPFGVSNPTQAEKRTV